MAKATPVPRRPRRTVIGATSAVVVVALVATLAVIADGYDAQQTPRLDTSVWVTRDDGQYARVNTDLGEIDTVRAVEDPSSVIQVGSEAFVLTQDDRLLWPVDPANPLDLTARATEEEEDPASTGSLNTPQGTRDIATAGVYVAYLTDLNTVYLGRLPEPGAVGDPTITRPVDPYAELFEADDPDALIYAADAVAVSPGGLLVMYSAEEKRIRRFDAAEGVFLGDPIAVESAPDGSSPLELAIVGEKWVLSERAESRLWFEGQPPIDTGLTSETLLQPSTAEADSVFLADQNQLISIDLESAEITELATGSGTPARPIVIDGVTYAAWLSASSGTLWSSEGGEVELDPSGDELDEVQTIAPVFRSNGARAVLSETSSGLLWTVPGGDLIPLEQWTIDDTELNVGEVEVDDVAQQEPPVAVADALGVRAGELVRLPLLLNDHDPNKKDVLSIAPGSLSGLADPSFGQLGLISNNQEAVIRVSAGSGATSFSYAVTDGFATSAPVVVSLTIIAPSENSAPVWCGVLECVQEWPTPQVAAGGTITVPILTGWVDPEGDPIVLIDARKDDTAAPITVVPTADGRIAIRHLDPNAAGGTIAITVSIADSRGANSTKTLELVVTTSPALALAPVAIVAGVGEKSTVFVADHVFGGSGTYRLIDATTLDAGLLVVSNTAAGTVEMTADAVGEYTLTYTVHDVGTGAEQSAIMRVSVIEGAPLAIAPLTTFVRANEDTTVDVLGAVQNTTGRVLLVSSAVSSDPTTLKVSVVGQSSVRVSGMTPDGLPGKIGTALVTVTDGAGASVEGTLTVFLAPPSLGIGAIAVPDTVTVRAGGQVDIPVTANDISPRGERLQLLPTVDTEHIAGELAFVNGDTVRYLAPTKEGVYTLWYSVYLGNEPLRPDTTTITVTVVAAGANRPPQPPILEARVLSGQSVQIPVHGFGMDPDGDAVVLAAVDQPSAGQGVASISADGASILYTAPGDGISGAQVSFSYTVRDAEGAEADGAVRVGVLDAEIADSAPVTYSDYIRAQKGSPVSVRVLPLLNDSDPADGELTLISVVPNAPAVESNPEYARLEGLIDPATSLEDGVVLLSAGDVLGTHSYIYTVQSSVTSSNEQGLIVVSVVDEGALDHPEVSDTVLTAKDRNQLAQGIDVVSGKVQWQTGDVGSLVLKLWGDNVPAGFEAKGVSISGPLPKKGAVIPFSLSGKDATGNPIVSYGFLRIPAINDMRLQLSSSLKPIKVDEEKSVSFDVLEAIDLDPSDKVAIRDEDSFIVQRANSSCTSTGSTEATYTAGREAPWTDYCAIPVRLEGQSTWTILAVPIKITPNEALAQLHSVTRTIAPGASETVDMEDMTSWQGDRVGDKSLLDYSILYSGSSFVVTQPTPTTIAIDARADAQPGTRESIQVSVSSFGGLSSAVTLVVGIAAPDTPRGATFTHQCDVREGASCAVAVIGQAGEYDPFEGKVGSGLTIESIGNGASVNCAVANISISGTTRLIATYPAGPKPAGGECIVPFSVKDAQGRIGAGQVTFDILGFPERPASITTVGYTGSSVTLNVALGEAANAHPSVSGVVIFEGSTQVPASCNLLNAATYQCVISGLENGEQHFYSARAENSIGQSLDTTVVTTSAYVAPNVSAFTVTSMFEPGISTTNARLELSIASDSDTLSFKVTTNTTVTIPRTGSVTVALIDAPVGTSSVTVVPVSQYQPPVGTNNEGTARVAAPSPTGAAIGQPYFTSGPAVTATDKLTLQVSGAALNANFAASSSRTYLAWRAATAPGTCTADAGGDLVVGGADVQSASPTFAVPESFVSYTVMVCGTNSFGVATSTQVAAYAGVLPNAPNGDNYRVNPNDNTPVDGTHVYALQNAPSINAPSDPDFEIVYTFAGAPAATFALSESANPTPIRVKYCAISAPTFCTAEAAITPDTANTIATVTFPTDAGGCIAAGAISTSLIGITSGVTGHNRSYSTRGGFGIFPDDEVEFEVTWNNGLHTVHSDWLDICP